VTPVDKHLVTFCYIQHGFLAEQMTAAIGLAIFLISCGVPHVTFKGSTLSQAI
jgi:hypothetical protein